MFTFNQLANFVAVAEELHFGRAAERLRMSQPPLSRQIQQLEKELKAQLFDRSSRSVRLTPAGRSFLQDARRLLRESEDAALAVHRVIDGRSGLVRIGFTATSAYGVLGSLLETARDRLPQVELVLRELVTRDQLDLLSSGTLDLGLMRPPISREELCSRPLLSEPLLAAFQESDPRACRGETLELSEFDGADVVMYSPSDARYFHELIVGMFNRADVTPRYSQYVSQVHTLLALVRAGLGAALVPASAARLRFEGVAFREVRLPDPRPVELHLAWRRDHENPALDSLLSLVGD
ncbi:LysR family transcriptional regulator [Parasphingorhabdus pacifica]